MYIRFLFEIYLYLYIISFLLDYKYRINHNFKNFILYFNYGYGEID